MEMQGSNLQDNVFGINDFSFRKIEKTDLDMLLQWRNSPRIHQKMLTDHLITAEEHKAWFARIHNSKVLRNLVFCYKDDPIGYQGFSEVDAENRIYSPGSYLGISQGVPPEAGVFMEFMSKEYAFFRLNASQLDVAILECNLKSLKINKFFGYVFDYSRNEYAVKQGRQEKIVKGVLTREQWEIRRQAIMEMLGIDKFEWEKLVNS